MAQVEIYRIKKTADPEIKDHGMFDFFGIGGPFPKNYVREWAGELPSGDLSVIMGRSVIDPPDDYHGGPLEKSDIVLVDGLAYFLDREPGGGYKFAEVGFDTSGIKPAIHVEYGQHVSLDNAVSISRSLAVICESIAVPTGYAGEPGYHGSGKGISDFESLPGNDYSACYLHPQFLKGEEAREFTGLLKDLIKSDRWTEAAAYLLGNYPIYQKDLEAARDLFAPELLFPSALQPLAYVIPSGADKAEVDLLAEKVGGMSEGRRDTLFAVVEAGWHCGSVAEIINLTQKLDCFELRPELTAERYGEWLLESAKTGAHEIVSRLEQSDSPGERDLATHIARLEASVSAEAYGLAEAKAEQGVFTSKGYITEEAEVRMVYRGPAHADTALTAADCVAGGMGEDLRGKAVAVRADAFLPEYRSAEHQLYLATGGFGCAPEARGRAVYGTNLRTGEQTRWDRSDILGVVADQSIPEWARATLAALQKAEAKEAAGMAPIETDAPLVLDRKNKKLVPVPRSPEQESVLEKIRQSKQQPVIQREIKPKKHDKGGPER